MRHTAPESCRARWFRLRRWRLRLWAALICLTPGDHAIAGLIARGDWPALDRLCDLLDAARDA